MIRVPRAFQGKPSAAQALRLNALLTIIALGWSAFALQHLLTSMHGMAAVDIITVVLTSLVCLWAVRSGDERKLDIAAHLAMVVSCGAIFGVSMLSGQDAAMASWYLTAVPLFSAYALGTRQAVIWAAVASVVILAVYVSPTFVQFEPEYVPNEQTWLMGKFVMLAVLLGLGVATRRATDANVDALAQRELIIRERARELAEARDEALAAVGAKDQFLANMSHEIRTPLNGIIGMTSVLLDIDQPEDQREMVKTIQRSSTALLGVLNEILDFSKLEASAVVLEKIPFELRDCVEDAIDLLGRTALEKGLDVYVRTDADVPPWIEGDITYLRQVLLNLIGNAIKFTDEGEVCVHVSVEGLERLHFEVCDTGIGIPEEKHDVLFRSFSQVDTSTTRKYGGTGLGLAISKRLIELMDGEIWVASNAGGGSTFHFTIAAPEAEPPVRPMTTQERLTLVGRHVTIVGGPPGSRGALVELLSGWGLRVDEVGDPLAPGQALPDSSTELVVAFDDSLDSLLSLAERPPLVVLLPLADAVSRDRARHEGVEAVVFRPMRQRALRHAIEAVLSGDQLQAHGPAFTPFDPTMGNRLPARILVGEDNPVNQRVACTVLEKLGYSPDVVPNGLEVLDALARRDYDILFLDLQMPGMDGLETTRNIRTNGSADEPWIVALTASVGVEQRTLAQKAGMNDFVSKPFDVQTLMVAIERWAQARGMMDEPSEVASVDDSPWGQLQQMFSGAPATLASLVADHIANGASLVAKIEVAGDLGDHQEVAQHAHALKSSAAQFGSDGVSRVSTELEASARAMGEMGDLVDDLREEWGRAEDRLRRELAELSSSVVPERA